MKRGAEADLLGLDHRQHEQVDVLYGPSEEGEAAVFVDGHPVVWQHMLAAVLPL